MSGDFLDRYIAGDPGAYYFQIEISNGRAIQGGHFYYKRDARQALTGALVRFLDDPSTLLGPQKMIKPRSVHDEDDDVD